MSVATAQSRKNAQNAPARYQRIAAELMAQIAGGRLQRGEQLPSVRALARQRRISATTAVAALQLLERRGLIEARPQSGFYVREAAPNAPEPQQTHPARSAHEVRITQLVSLLSAGHSDSDVAPLGAAMPEPSWLPARALQRRVASVARLDPAVLSRYGPLPGLPTLRHQIARRYAAIGCDLGDDDVLITNGCMEALNLALRAVAEPGATIAVESPAYFGILQVIETFGMKAVEIPTHPQTGLSVEALAELLESKVGKAVKACVVVSLFSNPIGANMPDARKRQLLAVCVKHDIALIEDDIYGELHFSGPRPLPIKSFDTTGQVILVSSFSKVLAPGSRIGWIAGGRWSDAVRLRKYVASIVTPVLMQQTLADFVASAGYERHLRKLRQHCAESMGRFASAVERNFPLQTRISRPEGGFVLWIEMPQGVNSLELHSRAKAAGVQVLPGPIFSAAGHYRNCIRINCGREFSPTMAAAVRRLGAIAQALLAEQAR